MSWLGNIFEGAKAAAQKAASDVANGVVWVGKQANDAAVWVGQHAYRAAVATANAVTYGVQVAENAVKSGIRSSEVGVANAGFDTMSAVDEAASAVGDAYCKTANAIAGFAKKVKSELMGRDPAKPVIPCPPSPAAQAQALTQQQKDIAVDGCLISYPGGKCAPVTTKGQSLSSGDIAAARSTGYQSQSSCCQKQRAIRGARGLPLRQITYVNGIKTSLEADCATIKAIGDQTCATVVGVYNATEGFYNDAIQTNQDRKLIEAAHDGKGIPSHDGRNPAVDSLSALIYRDVKAGNNPEIWAHSQGGAITSLALYDADNSLNARDITNGLSHVTVKSFGSAAPYWPKGIYAEHYVNVNDATPNFFGLGDNPTSDPVRAPGGKVIRFSGPPQGPYDEQDPSKDWLFAPTVHHGIDDTYLGMEKQEHGGC